MRTEKKERVEVPFLDLKAQYRSIKPEMDEAIQAVVDSCAFASGPFVAKFEDEYAAYCQTKYAIGVGSGTEALWLALLAYGIGPGDEVITVPNTFFATVEAIIMCGATPVLVDIDERTYTMDPALLENVITDKTKALIPVHIFGQMCDMDSIMDIAKKRDLLVIEDACQAHGAEYKGRKAGSIGHAGAFSFYPGKNLGAYGEAGAVTTNNEEAAEKMKVFRDHGQPKKYHHDVVGWNARMDGIQGAVLSVKLKHLDKWNDGRRRAASEYDRLLKDATGVTIPYVLDGNKPVYHLYEVRVPNRDAVLNGLQEEGIGCGIHYPVPIHQLDGYSYSDRGAGKFPVSERCTDEYLSLPIYPEILIENVQAVCRAVSFADTH
jgi:dTDP-4-amino-4,6-dideoxygalactose transaminase